MQNQNYSSADDQLRRLSASSPSFHPEPLTSVGSAGFYPVVTLPRASPSSGAYNKQTLVGGEPVLLEGSAQTCFGLYSNESSDCADENITMILSMETFEHDGYSNDPISSYGKWVASQVQSRTGASVESAQSDNLNNVPGFRKKRTTCEPVTFIISGMSKAVERAAQMIKTEYAVAPDLTVFRLPDRTPSDMLDRIDPEKRIDLNLNEEYGVLEARSSFRQKDAPSLLMACRREINQARGLETASVELTYGQLACLVGPSMNKTILHLCLEHGVIIDIGSPVVGELQPVLVSGMSVESAKKTLEALPSSVQSHSLSVDQAVIDFLLDSPRERAELVTLCQEHGCILLYRDDAITLYCGSAPGLQAALKRLHSRLYEYQHVSLHMLCAPSQEFSRELAAICRATSITAVIRPANLELVLLGGKQGVERAMECLSTACRHPWLRAVSWSLAVPHSVREFVSGKKDGKLVKIMRETGVQLSLAPMSDREESQPEHLLIRLEDNSILPVLTALALLRGELPAEVQFHVPECQHKRLIGHGGRVIQQVMKRHAVYVKFLNAAEAREAAYGQRAAGIEDDRCPLELPNVVVRTPAKNGAVLESVKEEILLMAEQTDEQVLSNNTASVVKELEERQGMRIVRTAIPHLGPSSLQALLKLLEHTPGINSGLSLKRSLRENDLAVIKVTGTPSKLDDFMQAFVSVLSVDERRVLLEESTPGSPTLTQSSGRSIRLPGLSSYHGLDLFKPFASALFLPKSPVQSYQVASMYQDLPSPPGAPGSGRSPVLSQTLSDTSSWSSSPITSPRTRTHITGIEQEMERAGKALDSPWLGKGMSSELGPGGLNCSRDPIVKASRNSVWDVSVYNTF